MVAQRAGVQSTGRGDALNSWAGPGLTESRDMLHEREQRHSVRFRGSCSSSPVLPAGLVVAPELDLMPDLTLSQHLHHVTAKKE